MSADGISVYTLAFPAPGTPNNGDRDFQQVNTSLSFSFDQVSKIRTLSTTDTTPGADIAGLLYTPNLDVDYCNVATHYIPTNATDVILPKGDGSTVYAWIAVAPWTTPNCTMEYFNLVNSRNDPLRAFIFFLPNNGTDIPPLANDPVWSLGDGGNWKRNNRFPVYAIPSDTATTILTNLANYTGNLTSVPNGHQIADLYPASDYVRLTMTIDVAGGNTLPSLWVFLLIVLGILIFIIGSTSFIMHFLQRRRRDRLRRRVATGEVDLEALGIKRLTVPKDVLDQMPVYTYAATPNNRISTAESDVLTGKETSSIITTAPAPGVEDRSYAQPTCAICLDDFVSGESQVRELPCRHIFHPECIDAFLKENSSLCPMCKKTVLPTGYCPAVITNAMVRRERMIRRLRDRQADQEAGGARGTLARLGHTGRHLFSVSQPQRPSLQPQSAIQPVGEVEMVSTSPLPNAESVTVPPMSPTGRQSPHNRREWARQRALAMIGRGRGDTETAVEEEERRRPAWRRVVGKIWPGLA